MIILSAEHVRAILSMKQCIELMEQAMTETSAGNALLPLRWAMRLPEGGLMGMMPGYSATSDCFGIKVVNVMPQNHGTSLSSHVGAMILFDSANGAPLALIDTAEVTAFRTAAASALATRVLARQDARVLTLVGTGEQAVSHLNAMCLVREFNEIRVCSRSLERARAFAAAHSVEGVIMNAFCDVEESIDGADVICTMTNASKPFLHGDMLHSGVHVNLVGASTAEKQEAHASVVSRSKFFVDYEPSARAQAGEIVEASKQEPDICLSEIGSVLSGRASGREDDEDITVYRSLGVATQDLVVAWYLNKKGRENNIGVHVAF